MTKGLVRYQQAGDLHFITFSCYGRKPYLASPAAKELFETSLEKMRRKYGFRRARLRGDAGACAPAGE